MDTITRRALEKFLVHSSYQGVRKREERDRERKRNGKGKARVGMHQSQ
jgi:hypothetical protein